jgi:trans-2,3-dihydro-3-hydroxyanthranilate isomerase
LNASDLTTEQMQTITRQMNYSESTFVTSEGSETISFRIFAPHSELPFAGHPTIGTSYLLEHLNRLNGNFPRDSVHVKLEGGEILINFESSDNIIKITYMNQLPVEYYGEFEEKSALLKSIGINQDEVISQKTPIYAPSDLKFVILPIDSEQLLDSITPNYSELGEALASDESLVIVSPSDKTDFAMRMFAPNQGINEDPATGSAQNAVIHALRDFGLLQHKKLVMMQVKAIGRPSVLYNEIITSENDRLSVKTGGNCYIVISGKIFID